MLRRAAGHIRRQPVAFLALFFALGGSAMAGTGYLTKSSKITKGDLAGSTYGNPVIAPGTVTNQKLANPSLTITAGTGLTGGGSIALGGSGNLSVDPTAVQNRVTGTCSSGNAISSVNQNGTVGCQSTLPDAYSYTNANSIGLAIPGGPLTTVASVDVPAGSYVINAKTVLFNQSTFRTVICQLDGGTDTSETRLGGTGTAGDLETTPLQATETFVGPSTVSLACAALSGNANEVQALDRTLTAVKVGTIH